MSIEQYLYDSMHVFAATAHNYSMPYDRRFNQATDILCKAIADGRPILSCGNGGSAADAEHFTAELVGRFSKERNPVNAISLCSNAAVLTAIVNDYTSAYVFSRQMVAHMPAVLVAISTSGNSVNVLEAARVAQRHHCPVIALTGLSGGRLRDYATVLLNVLSEDTPMIQQVHICFLHYLCTRIEKELFPCAKHYCSE